MKKLLLASAFLCFNFSAHAETSILPASMQHKAEVEVGTGLGTGNIDKQNITVGGKLTSTTGRYKNQLKGNYSNLDSNNNSSKNVYKVNEKLKYEISTDDYAYGELEYVNNDVSGINRRTSESVGYGRNLISRDNLNLAAEAGIGMRQSDYKAGLTNEDSYMGKIGTDMDWEIYDNINFNNETYMAFTEDNIQTVSDSSIKTFVYDGVYLKGGFNVENNDKAPAGFKNTDTTTTATVGYEF